MSDKRKELIAEIKNELSDLTDEELKSMLLSLLFQLTESERRDVITEFERLKRI